MPGTLGTIASYGAIIAVIGGIIMFILSIAGLIHIRRTQTARRYNPQIFQLSVKVED
jgi:uncharacterized membrane protein